MLSCKHKVWLLSIFFGIFSGFIDNVADWLWFYPEHTFHELMFRAIPAHEIWMRSVMLGLFLVFGYICGIILERKEKMKKEIKRKDDHLLHLRALTTTLSNEGPTHKSHSMQV